MSLPAKREYGGARDMHMGYRRRVRISQVDSSGDSRKDPIMAQGIEREVITFPLSPLPIRLWHQRPLSLPHRINPPQKSKRRSGLTYVGITIFHAGMGPFTSESPSRSFSSCGKSERHRGSAMQETTRRSSAQIVVLSHTESPLVFGG
jgi:hypothetical protein